MSWECHAREADDCVLEDLFDPPYRDPDGSPICLRCAEELGIHDPDTGLPVDP